MLFMSEASPSMDLQQTSHLSHAHMRPSCSVVKGNSQNTLAHLISLQQPGQPHTTMLVAGGASIPTEPTAGQQHPSVADSCHLGEAALAPPVASLGSISACKPPYHCHTTQPGCNVSPAGSIGATFGGVQPPTVAAAPHAAAPTGAASAQAWSAASNTAPHKQLCAGLQLVSPRPRKVLEIKPPATVPQTASANKQWQPVSGQAVTPSSITYTCPQASEHKCNTPEPKAAAVQHSPVIVAADVRQPSVHTTGDLDGQGTVPAPETLPNIKKLPATAVLAAPFVPATADAAAAEKRSAQHAAGKTMAAAMDAAPFVPRKVACPDNDRHQENTASAPAPPPPPPLLVTSKTTAIGHQTVAAAPVNAQHPAVQHASPTSAFVRPSSSLRLTASAAASARKQSEPLATMHKPATRVPMQYAGIATSPLSSFSGLRHQAPGHTTERPAPVCVGGALKVTRVREFQQLDSRHEDSPGASESSSVWHEPPAPRHAAVWEEQGGDWEATGRMPVISPVVSCAAAQATDLLLPLPGLPHQALAHAEQTKQGRQHNMSQQMYAYAVQEFVDPDTWADDEDEHVPQNEQQQQLVNPDTWADDEDEHVPQHHYQQQQLVNPDTWADDEDEHVPEHHYQQQQLVNPDTWADDEDEHVPQHHYQQQQLVHSDTWADDEDKQQQPVWAAAAVSPAGRPFDAPPGFAYFSGGPEHLQAPPGFEHRLGTATAGQASRWKHHLHRSHAACAPAIHRETHGALDGAPAIYRETHGALDGAPAIHRETHGTVEGAPGRAPPVFEHEEPADAVPYTAHAGMCGFDGSMWGAAGASLPASPSQRCDPTLTLPQHRPVATSAPQVPHEAVGWGPASPPAVDTPNNDAWCSSLSVTPAALPPQGAPQRMPTGHHDEEWQRQQQQGRPQPWTHPVASSTTCEQQQAPTLSAAGWAAQQQPQVRSAWPDRHMSTDAATAGQSSALYGHLLSSCGLSSPQISLSPGAPDEVATDVALVPDAQAQLTQQQQQRDLAEVGELLPLQQLLPEHAAELEAACPRGTLPEDWSRYSSWTALERAMECNNGMRHGWRYVKAKIHAQKQSAAALAELQQQQQQDTWHGNSEPSHVSTVPQVQCSPRLLYTPLSTDAAAMIYPASDAWLQTTVQQLLSGSHEILWRAILPPPSNACVGPYSSAELAAWLGPRSRVPHNIGVSEDDARAAAANPASLKLCGIMRCAYRDDRLPGPNFYKPLSSLLSAVSAGMEYSPVSWPELKRGSPRPNWNNMSAATQLPRNKPRYSGSTNTATAKPQANTPKIASAARPSRQLSSRLVHAAVTAAAAAHSASVAGCRRSRVKPGLPVQQASGIGQPAEAQTQTPRSLESFDDWGARPGETPDHWQVADQTSGSGSTHHHAAAATAPTCRADATRHSTSTDAPQPGSCVSKSALQHLLADKTIKWRVMLPSGDRAGPLTAAELVAWVDLRGPAPQGVDPDDHLAVLQQPGSLKLCGIQAKDYNIQKLPGAKFFKPLSQLLAAASAGQRYEPVTKALLNRGIPPQGWNESAGSTAMPSDNPVVAGAAPSEVHARADDTVSLQGQASQESLHFRSEATGQSAAIQPAMARAADCMPAAKEGFHGMWPAAGEGMASPAACQEVSNADHWRSKLGDSTSCQWWHDASAAHGTSAYPWTPQLLATSHDTGEAPLLLASPHATGQAPQLLATTHGIGQAPQLQQHHQHQGSVLTSPAVFSGLDTTPLATQQRVQPVCDVDRDPASLQVQSKQEQMPLLPYTNMSHISMPHHPGASVGVPASCHHTVSSLPPFLQQGSSLDHHGLLQQGQLPVVSDADDTNDEFAEMLQLLGA